MTNNETASGRAAPLGGAIDRITGLDVTRGFAVMGILLMNIVAFAMPEAAYITPQHWGGDTGADLAVWAVNFVLFDSKMRGLFSMLFGASTLLVIESALAGGRNAQSIHMARMATLLLFGLAHYYLLWFGDILFGYAAMGMLLYLFRNKAVKALTIWGSVLIALNALLLTLMTIGLYFGSLPGAPEGAAQAYADFSTAFAYHSADGQAEYTLLRSDFLTIVTHRLTEDPLAPLNGLIMYGAETLGLMLIGMALFKSGLFKGQWSQERLALWRNRCLGIGIAGNLVLLWPQFASDLNPAIVLGATMSYSVPFDVVMSIGYAALFMGLAQRFASAPFIARIAATGRAAFSNYLGTTILMTFIFYGWGLGQFGEWPRASLYLLVPVAWVIMLLWSKPWLERFHYGPLEWLWRSMARREWQPMRRTL